MALPSSPACARNREPILAVLRRHFADVRRVLEIGSGTGEHAVHFAAALPHLAWQPSERPEALDGLNERIHQAALSNLRMPLPLAAQASPHPLMPAGLAADPETFARLIDGGNDGRGFDAVFSANTLHIMGWREVEGLFAGLPALLAEGPAMLALYGPFNRGGGYTSESNREFDAWLKARDVRSGIRDFEAVDVLARGIGFTLVDDVAMPANNALLLYARRSN